MEIKKYIIGFLLITIFIFGCSKEVISPICGNNVCENYGGVNEWNTCLSDCSNDIIPPDDEPNKPVCGNNKCEVFSDIDEFETCKTDCGWEEPKLDEQIDCYEPTHTNPYLIDIYYLYNNNLNSGYKDIVNNAVNCGSQFLKSYNGRTFKIRNLQAVKINSINFEGQNLVSYFSVSSTDRERKINLLFKELISKTNIKNNYETSHATWIVMGNMGGGSFTWRASPVFHSENILSDKNIGKRVVHEFLHNYGCEDSKQLGCIMYDLSIDNLKDSLCSCKYEYKESNYIKFPLSELTGSKLLSIVGITKETYLDR